MTYDERNAMERELFLSAERYLTKGDRSNLKILYGLAGLRGKKRNPDVPSYFDTVRGNWTDKLKINQLSNTSSAKDIFTRYITKIKSNRRDARGEPYEFRFSAAMRGCHVKIGDNMYHPKASVNWMANRIAEWRPNIIGDMSATLVKHSREKSIDIEGRRLRITPSEARLRRSRCGEPLESNKHIPIIATDRFVMWFVGGVPDEIRDGDDVEVLFISDDNKPKLTAGWLSKHGSEFGCSVNKSDARKAAKMKTIRKAKKALGLI